MPFPEKRGELTERTLLAGVELRLRGGFVPSLTPHKKKKKREGWEPETEAEDTRARAPMKVRPLALCRHVKIHTIHQGGKMHYHDWNEEEDPTQNHSK